MTFENSIWLAITPLLAVLTLAIMAMSWRKRTELLSKFAATRLLDKLTEQASTQRLALKSALILIGVCAIGVALSRPQYGVEWSERKARGLDIVFALDSSKSMLATDLRPTRLERAKLAILDLIERLESDRIGLVAFAGQAFLQTPPTLDYSAFRESLDATDPSILTRGGSDLGRAIEEAANAFPSENNVKVVVLLTDGEDLGGRAIEAAKNAANDGIQIFAIGIGTPEGEYLRIRNEAGIEEFVRDESGQPVRSQLDVSTLQQIAQLTGGSFTQLGGGSLDTLYNSVLSTLPREERESELQEIRIERFQWLLAAALFFLVLEILIRSRGSKSSHAALLAASLITLAPNTSEAETTKPLEAYNQAYGALQAGEYTQAEVLYTQAMQQTKDRDLQRDALYNMAHARYQQGRSAYDGGDIETALRQITEAEQLFESAQELDPNDGAITQDKELTSAVREAIEQIVEQQQDQQEQENQDDQSDSEEQENQDSEQQDQQESGDQSEQSESEESQDQQDSQGSEQSQQDGSEQESNQTEESEEQSAQNEDGESQEEEPEQSESANSEEESTEEGEEESEPVPQVAEEQDGESGDEQDGASQSTQAVQVEGMTIEEAQDLLDSLRNKEEILPFAQPVPGNGRKLQDW